MLKIKFPTKPYDTKRILQDSYEFKTGVNVLVGKNGIGKSTLLRLLADSLIKKEIPFIVYNNLVDGGDNAMSLALNKGQMSMLRSLALHSEGEQISTNLGYFANKVGRFVHENRKSNQRWILLDAVDSGLSINNINELKSLFKLIKQDCKKNGIDVYIIAAANTFALAKDEACICVRSGQDMKFTNYEDFENFILGQ